MQYKRELQAIMEDMRLPYDIESMTKIRHEAFRKNLNMQRHGLPMRVPLVRTVSSSQRTRVIQMAQTATTTRSFQQPVTVRTMHQLQPMQPMRVATYEQHSYIGQQQQPQQQPHMVQMQSATTTMETVCADMQMQIPTVTSSIMAGPAMPTENYYQVYTTNGQTIDPSIPVYFISSTEPITVEVSSSDDVIGIAIDNSDQVSVVFIPLDTIISFTPLDSHFYLQTRNTNDFKLWRFWMTRWNFHSHTRTFLFQFQCFYFI